MRLKYLNEASNTEFNSNWPVDVMSEDEVVSKVASLPAASFFTVTHVKRATPLAAYDPQKKSKTLKSGKLKYEDTPSIEACSVTTYQARTGIIYSDRVRAVAYAHSHGRRTLTPEESEARNNKIKEWIIRGRLGINKKGTKVLTLFIRYGKEKMTIANTWFMRIDNGDWVECKYEDVSPYIQHKSSKPYDPNDNFRTFGYASYAAALSSIVSNGKMSKKEEVGYAQEDNPEIADVITADTIDVLGDADNNKINAQTLSNELSDELGEPNTQTTDDIRYPEDPEDIDFDEEEVVNEHFFRDYRGGHRIVESLRNKRHIGRYLD